MISDRDFDSRELHSFFERNDECFMRPLAESLVRFNITFGEYMKKLASHGTIAYERDSESGMLKGVVIGYTNNLPDDRGSYITQVLTDKSYFRQGVCLRLLNEYKEYCMTKISRIYG